MSTPGGWTQLYNITASNNLRRFAAFWKSASGSEGASVNVAVGGGDGYWATIAHRIPAADWTGTPEAATATGSTGSPNPPSLTPSWGSDANLWLAAGAHLGVFGPIGTPSGYSNQVSASAIDRIRIAAAQREAEAVSENPGSFSAFSAPWAAATVAVRRP
jgi:hypothetical protein